MTETRDPTGEIISPLFTQEAEADLVRQLIEQILGKAHPLLAKGIYLAALLPEYDTELFTALRGLQDGRDERLVTRLAQFSFIQRLDAGPGEDKSRYAMLVTEREILLHHWIEIDPQAFIAAHRRALAFRQNHPHPEPFTQDQNILYHLLITDGKAGLAHLADTFRAYANERHLAAADRLLAVAVETRAYLAALAVSWLTDLDDLLAYLTARLAQLRGEWQTSLPVLKKLRQRTDLSIELLPYIARAYGLALAETGQYVEAIEQYQTALAIFGRQPKNKIEQAFTMINLGDAHVELAVSARGYREIIAPAGGRWRQWLKGMLSLRALLPLIAYLSIYFGLRVWRPGFWPMLQGQDWIIARLFVTGGRWYHRAKNLLDKPETHTGRVQADEKLAHLYLTLGDAEQAVSSFQTLLQEREAPLGEYRRGSVLAGLGQALLRLQRPKEAQVHLQKALPVIRAYDDVELEAEIYGLLAEISIGNGQHPQALLQFQQALHLYQSQGDRVGATEIAERLQELSQDKHLAAQDRQTASTSTQNLTRRQYLKRFQHPALVTFRRVGLILLAAFIFIIPMLAIHVETGSVLLADIHFYASPLLEPDPNFTPSLSQAVALNIIPTFKSDFVLRRVIELTLLYLLSYTLLGIILILRTRLETVQAAQSEAVQFNLTGVTIGCGDTERAASWSEIDNIYTADVELLDGPMADNSQFVLSAAGEKIAITGSTAWYTALRNHILSFARKANITDLGYRVLWSRMGLLYISSATSLILFLLLREWAPNVLTTDLLASPYNLADLYPYLYLGLFLPPFWWIVIRPLHIQTHLNPRSPLPWWIGAAGVLLAVLRWITSPTSWLGLPDIYPLLAIGILLGSAGLAIWKTRRPDVQPASKRRHLYPLWMRVSVVAVCATLFIIFGRQLWSQVEIYHYLILGNSQRDRAMQIQAQDQNHLAAWYLRQAAASYDRVLELAPHNTTALNSSAAVQAQLGLYENAIDAYTNALKYSGADAEIYADRAMAFGSWGLTLSPEKETGAAEGKFAAALNDLDQAIQLDPGNADYYLQRGIIHHSLGQLEAAQKDFERVLLQDPANDRALTGQGWAHFEQAHHLETLAGEKDDETEQAELKLQSLDGFRRALESLKKAARYNQHSAEIWLALGYAHFKLEEYQSTLIAWQMAVKVAPDDPDMIVSRGTAHWLLANGSRCRSDQVSDEEKAEAVYRLNLAIDDLNRALELHPYNDWTYRTRAQIEYLLRFCPGYDYKEQIKSAIASYDKALAYAPENDLYWQFRGRLGFVLGRYIFLNETDNEAEAWAILSIAAQDINRAYTIDPENEETQVWKDYILNEGWGRYHWLRGWNYYEAGNYSMAETDSEMAALLIPDDAELAFNTGLAALAQGKADQATAWYIKGFKRAKIRAVEEPEEYISLLETAMTDLGDLLETNPSLRWLGEPVLGLCYLQLGQDHLAAGNYPLAWAEFEQAATLRPRDAEAAFNAGLLSLTLGRGVQAMEWYTEGIARATLDGEILPLLQPAIDDLSALLDTNPRLKWLCAPILKTMQTAAGADSDSK